MAGAEQFTADMQVTLTEADMKFIDEYENLDEIEMPRVDNAIRALTVSSGPDFVIPDASGENPRRTKLIALLLYFKRWKTRHGYNTPAFHDFHRRQVLNIINGTDQQRYPDPVPQSGSKLVSWPGL